MRAIEQDEFGGPDVLHVADVPTPEPGGTEVLVRVLAAGVNPVDWKTRQGSGYLSRFPMRLGWDVRGVVEALGAGVTRFAVGDEVFGLPWFPRPAGAYAEYVTAPSRQLARAPDALSAVEAAGLPMAGLTAWQALVDTAGIAAGQRVLVNAAAGGVGHVAVQLAVAYGARVHATASATKQEFVRGLGAEVVLDYRDDDALAQLSDLDVVFDPVGGPGAMRWAQAVRPGGRLIVFGAGSGDAVAAASARGVAAGTLLVEPDGHALDQLAHLADDGKLRVHVDRRFPLEQVRAAHEFGEQGHTTGKIVLTVADG